MPSPYREKPVVQYDATEEAYIRLGHPAIVKTINHPGENVSNLHHVRTSKVIGIDEESGEFETMNTKYKPHFGE